MANELSTYIKCETKKCVERVKLGDLLVVKLSNLSSEVSLQYELRKSEAQA